MTTRRKGGALPLWQTIGTRQDAHAKRPRTSDFGSRELRVLARTGVRRDTHVVDRSLRSELGAREVELLERAVRLDDESDPTLLDLPLSDLVADDLNDLRSAVTVLLIAEGLDQHDNHNEFGDECEDLIDRLGPWHWGKDDD